MFWYTERKYDALCHISSTVRIIPLVTLPEEHVATPNPPPEYRSEPARVLKCVLAPSPSPTLSSLNMPCCLIWRQCSMLNNSILVEVLFWWKKIECLQVCWPGRMFCHLCFGSKKRTVVPRFPSFIHTIKLEILPRVKIQANLMRLVSIYFNCSRHLGCWLRPD
jgi:hypothetical protein